MIPGLRGAGGSRRWAPAAVVVTAVVAGAAVVLAGVGSGWWSTVKVPSPVEAVVVTPSLATRSVAFGDPVEARLDVVVDTRRSDERSVRITASFAPYAARALPVERSPAGPALLLRHRWRLECLVEACLPALLTRTFSFPPAAVSAGEQTLRAAWPTLEVARRTTAADEARTAPAWRLETALPESSWGASATTLAWLLGGGAAALLLAAGALLALALRPGPRERRRLSGLERALALARESLAADDGARRRALESLAAELRREPTAPGELAAVAERLAWSAAPPAADDVAALAARVEEARR